MGILFQVLAQAAMKDVDPSQKSLADAIVNTAEIPAAGLLWKEGASIDMGAVKQFAQSGGLPPESPSMQNYGAALAGASSAGTGNVAKGKGGVERV